jgi:FMN phosphatase YigB (HAD superfamily)
MFRAEDSFDFGHQAVDAIFFDLGDTLAPARWPHTRTTEVDAIFFDLGDTLVHLLDEVWRTAASLIQDGLSASVSSPQCRLHPDDLRLAHQKYLRQANTIPAGSNLGEASEYAIFQAYFGRLLAIIAPAMKPDAANRVADYLAARTVDETSYECFPDVLPTLDRLECHGIRLGIISNAHPSARRILQHLSLERRFEWVLLSNEVKVAKPSFSIYQLALDYTHSTRNRVLFLDDRARFLHLRDGSALPMMAVLIDRGFGHLEDWPGPMVTGLDMLI